MYWEQTIYGLKWSQEIKNYEEKAIAAKKIAAMAKNGDIIGFGSGSTSFLAVKAIAERMQKEQLSIAAIPTSNEIKTACAAYRIPALSLLEAKPDWCFDGADEVNPDNWLIKGRGGAMFHEKMVIANAPAAYILVDKSKFVSKLGEKFPIPVECIPSAYISVKNKLLQMGAYDIQLRLAGGAKDGPVITENGNIILDVKFETIEKDYEVKLKSICGVLETGLFIGYPVEIVTC